MRPGGWIVLGVVALVETGVDAAVTRIEDGSPLLAYAGNWQTASADFFSAGSCRWTAQRADQVRFTGDRVTNIALIGITGRFHAAATVRLDGVTVAQLQTFLPAGDVLNVTVWQSPELDPSVSHTVQFIKTGDDDLHFSVDSLLVTTAEDVPAPPAPAASTRASLPPLSASRSVSPIPPSSAVATSSSSLVVSGSTASSLTAAAVATPVRPALPVSSAVAAPATQADSVRDEPNLPRLLAIGLGVLGTFLLSSFAIWFIWRRLRLRRRGDLGRRSTRFGRARSSSSLFDTPEKPARSTLCSPSSYDGAASDLDESVSPPPRRKIERCRTVVSSIMAPLTTVPSAVVCPTDLTCAESETTRHEWHDRAAARSVSGAGSTADRHASSWM